MSAADAPAAERGVTRRGARRSPPTAAWRPGRCCAAGPARPTGPSRSSTGEPHLVRDDFWARPGPPARPAAGRPLLCLVAHHRPAAGRRPVADQVRVPEPLLRRPEVRRDRAGAAAAGGAHRARGRRHAAHPQRGARPGHRAAAAARGHHRRRDRQRAVERDAGLPGPVRRRPGAAGLRRARATPACSRWTGRTTSSGSRTARAGRRRTSSGASSASRTIPGCWSGRCAEFSAAGLRVPWLSCFGNHEALNQGVGVVTPGLAAALIGGRKPVRLPDDFDHDRALELFTEQPEAFMAGPAVTITADPGRRPVTRQEFVGGALPAGRAPGRARVHRAEPAGRHRVLRATTRPAARLIALDTSCAAPGERPAASTATRRAGSTDRLAEVHSAYRGPDGREVRTGHEDRLVDPVLAPRGRHADQHPGRTWAGAASRCSAPPRSSPCCTGSATWCCG